MQVTTRLYYLHFPCRVTGIAPGCTRHEEGKATLPNYISIQKRGILGFIFVDSLKYTEKTKYVEFLQHNRNGTRRTHAGWGKEEKANLRTPCWSSPITATPVLGGLHHTYSRTAHLH